MSKKEKVTEQKEQKVMTKYDLKMQKRKEQKEKELREKRKSTIIGVAILVALVCLVASFPIRTYLAVNQTYVTVAGEKVSKLEFDYNYNMLYNNYMNTNGSYLSYFGVDLSSNLDTQMYDDTMTWKDFFDKMAIDNLKQSKAILAEAEAVGFTYDTTEEYKNFEESIKSTAELYGLSVNDYVKQVYGSYATLNRISDLVKESMVVSAFYNQKMEELAPTAEEIQAYYESDTASYDSVDYRLTTIEAELPTAPTELADTTATDAADTTTDAATTETETYQPSEAEIAKAMEDAKVLADAAEANVATEGELVENATKSATLSQIRDWLFDDARVAGDTTVIEDSTNKQYYVIAFEKRYLDETPTADIRVIITAEDNGQTILDEWKNGEATEDSFAALCAEYSVDSSASEGGLMEGISKSGLDEELSAWMFDAARVAGDTVAITPEGDTYTYVMYYVGQNDPEYKISIKDTLSSQTMSDYINSLTEKITVEDPSKNIDYLWYEETVPAETAAAEAVETESAATAESVEAETEATATTEAQ